MRIAWVTSEVAPFSKTGGLGDVSGSLPRRLASMGHEVWVVSPWYATLGGPVAPYWIGDVEVPFDGGFDRAGVGTCSLDGVGHAFVGHADFSRDAPYGFDDDVRRFARFSRSVPAVCARLGFLPDVVHAHDWHAGFVPLVTERGWHLPPGWPGIATVFTIHNLQYQGIGALDEVVHWLRLPSSAKSSGLDHFGAANAMQAGIDHAHRVTTVSPTYAREIRTPAYGHGLDGTLRHVAGKLEGILNGLDLEAWDPLHDAAVAAPFGPDDPSPKRFAAAALTSRLGLEDARPVIGVVSRLADQKGIDTFLAAIPDLVEIGWNVALLGAGEAGLEAWAATEAVARPSRVAVTIGYDDALARSIYAGSAALAIPSRFEPCGLTQLIAMRYGTLPVARATGGLVDTIDDGATGFLYAGEGKAPFVDAARRAFAVVTHERLRREMQVHAMTQRFGWERSALAYERTYAAAMVEARSTGTIAQ